MFKNKVFLFLIISIIFIVSFFLKNQLSELGKNNISDSNNKSNQKLECTRTTRLDNKPPYDRALSLIEEKNSLLENGEEKQGSFYSFPSKLVNCIKIVEGDLRGESGNEGLFIFNDSEIRDDYFPIQVDKDYSYSDDLVTSLLLVHEITHVNQYIKSLNKVIPSLSCIDKETEAFYSQWQFYGIQYSESRKSIDYRIENDKKLHPQLQMINLFKTSFDLDGVRNECLYGEGKNNEECIDNYRKNEIRQLLLQNDFYKKQCNL